MDDVAMPKFVGVMCILTHGTWNDVSKSVGFSSPGKEADDPGYLAKRWDVVKLWGRAFGPGMRNSRKSAWAEPGYVARWGFPYPAYLAAISAADVRNDFSAAFSLKPSWELAWLIEPNNVFLV